MTHAPTAWPAGIRTGAPAAHTVEIPRPERELTDADHKEQALLRTLAGWPALIVAYSGGVDSAYLAWAATRVLGRGALCITADSPSYPDRHRALARQIAADFGFAHEVIHTSEMARPDTGRIPRTAVTTASTSSTRTWLGSRARAGFPPSPTVATRTIAGTTGPGVKPRRNSASRAPSMRSAWPRPRSASCPIVRGCPRGTSPRRRACRRAFRTSAR